MNKKKETLAGGWKFECQYRYSLKEWTSDHDNGLSVHIGMNLKTPYGVKPIIPTCTMVILGMASALIVTDARAATDKRPGLDTCGLHDQFIRYYENPQTKARNGVHFEKNSWSKRVHQSNQWWGIGEFAFDLFIKKYSKEDRNNKSNAAVLK